MRIEPRMPPTGAGAFTGALLLLFTGAAALGHEGSPSRYNFRDDVRPIFLEHCGGCHRSGGVAPMSLLQYREVVPWANAIKMQVLEQNMPPWLPAEGVGGEFRHARTLTAEEIDVIVDWAVGQTPEGEPLSAAELEGPQGAAPPREPDLVLEAETEVVVAKDAFEKHLCLVLDTGLTEPRVITAFDVMSAKPTVLRRATIYEGSSCDTGTPLATWLPDQPEATFPEAAGAALGSGARVAVELYYVKGWNDEGERIVDRPKLGLRFSDSATPLASTLVEGPSYRLEEPAALVALYPNLEESGGRSGEEPLRVDALLPDGTARPILRIERYAPEWREKYVLERPLELPAGAEIRVSEPAVWLDFLPVAPASAE